MRLHKLVPSTLICATLLSVCAPTAEAGPFLDWLFGRNRNAPAYPVGAPVPMGNGQASYYGNYAGAAPYPQSAAYYGNYYNAQLPVIGNGAAGYLPPTANASRAPSLPPNTLSYTPAFRTNSYRAPVTYYRPILTTDPATGAQVVTQAPCTSYEYQTQRAPILGSRELYNTRMPAGVQPAPQALPTYTIPSGGIPLAATQAPNQTYRGYPSYSTPVPPQNGAYGSGYGTYPTGPATGGYRAYSQSDYYGDANTNSGGSTGSLPQRTYPAPSYPTPGLTAPVGPPPSSPGRVITPAPTYGQPVPGPAGQTSPGSSSPPVGSPSADPADRAPVLPPASSASTQYRGMQSIARGDSAPAQQSSAGNQPETTNEPEPNPFMSPIPAPKDFEMPKRWNPGLLRENDMTAMRAIPAGASKRIHWASFEESARQVEKPVVQSEGDATNGLRPVVRSTQERASRAQGQLQRQWEEQRNWQRQAISQPAEVSNAAPVREPIRTNQKPTRDRSRYDTSGWQRAK